MKSFKRIHDFLIVPKSEDMQTYQRELILNIILIGLILIFAVLSCLSICFWMYYQDHFTGASPIYVVSVLIFYIFLWILSRLKYVNITRWILIITFVIFSNMVAVISGIENPITLLLFAWTFNLTGVLLGRISALVLYFLTSVDILLLSYLQVEGLIAPDLHWKIIPLNFGLGISYVSVLLNIALISFLYNQRITNSLDRVLESEKELQTERDLLEERVHQRTKILEKTQIEQINQLAKFAEFGKSMSGLLHDLINPITAISLNLGHLNNVSNNKELKGVKEYSQRALSATKKMEQFVVSAKNKLRNRQDVRKFYLKKEIKEVAKFFVFKARKKNILISVDVNKNIYLVGDVVKFDQIISNLFSNSIDAFENVQKKNKIINISASKFEDNIQIIFNDNGKGIKKGIVENIFKPFFTTKKRRAGIGIGLYITKSIIENDFGGSISVTSIQNDGATFYISLPNNCEKIS